MFKFLCFLVFGFMQQCFATYLLNFSVNNDVLRILFQNNELAECEVPKQCHTGCELLLRYVVLLFCFRKNSSSSVSRLS